MDVKLNIFDGSAHRFSKVVHLPCTIGRSRLSHISIVHPLVSRQHCEIYEDSGLVMLRDLGSLNGTYFKNARIGRGVALPYGEVFSIGPIHFVIEKIAVPPQNGKNGADESSGWKMDQPPMGQPSAISSFSSEADPKIESMRSILSDPIFGENRTGDGSSVTQVPALSSWGQPNQKEPSTVDASNNDFLKELAPKTPSGEASSDKKRADDNLDDKILTSGQAISEPGGADQSDDFDFLWDETFNKK